MIKNNKPYHLCFIICVYLCSLKLGIKGNLRFLKKQKKTGFEG